MIPEIFVLCVPMQRCNMIPAIFCSVCAYVVTFRKNNFHSG